MAEDAQDEKGKLFIGGLNRSTTESTLSEYFEEYGKLKDVVVKRDPSTLESKGFAFIKYEDPSVVLNVLEDQDKNGHYIDDKRVDVKKAVPMKPSRPPPQDSYFKTKKIFVGGVPPDTEKEPLEEYFSNFGDIEELALVTDKATGKRRGFIFVVFVSDDSVDEVLKSTFHTIKGTEVECKRARPRDNKMPFRNERGSGGSYQGGREQQRHIGYPQPNYVPGYYGSAYYGGGYNYSQPQSYGGYQGFGGGGGAGGYGGYSPQENTYQPGGGDHGHGNWRRQNDSGGSSVGGNKQGPIRPSYSPQPYHPYPRP